MIAEVVLSITLRGIADSKMDSENLFDSLYPVRNNAPLRGARPGIKFLLERTRGLPGGKYLIK